MAKQKQQNQQKPIPATLKRFGKEYCFQGVFTDTKELNETKTRWAGFGHKPMVVKQNRLYVTRFPQ